MANNWQSEDGSFSMEAYEQDLADHVDEATSDSYEPNPA